ncbi:hypothetical protein TorRG33x02_097080 [Trema orientale]|uniref:Uncharacterized protein n=1 Tax=Trema orientale TaxID=63057 RepID=A0A2P5F9J1_TREOI|nr:hypothetical protein TorRG33x02_097080 [Trema orientale]
MEKMVKAVVAGEAVTAKDWPCLFIPYLFHVW